MVQLLKSVGHYAQINERSLCRKHPRHPRLPLGFMRSGTLSWSLSVIPSQERKGKKLQQIDVQSNSCRRAKNYKKQYWKPGNQTTGIESRIKWIRRLSLHELWGMPLIEEEESHLLNGFWPTEHWFDAAVHCQVAADTFFRWWHPCYRDRDTTQARHSTSHWSFHPPAHNHSR